MAAVRAHRSWGSRPLSIAGVVLAAGAGARYAASGGVGPKPLAEVGGIALVDRVLAIVGAAGFDEVVLVDGRTDLSDRTAPGVTVLHNAAWADGIATSLQAAVAHARAAGHEAIVVGLADQPGITTSAWRARGRRPRGAADRRGHLRRTARQPGALGRRGVGSVADDRRRGRPLADAANEAIWCERYRAPASPGTSTPWRISNDGADQRLPSGLGRRGRVGGPHRPRADRALHARSAAPGDRGRRVPRHGQDQGRSHHRAVQGSGHLRRARTR